MREIFTYLNSSISILPGVGEKVQEAFERLNCRIVFDLLTHFPTRIIFRSVCDNIGELESNSEVIIKLKFIEIEGSSRSKVNKVICDSNGTPVELLYFNYFPHYIFNSKKFGDEIIILGTARIHPKNGIQVAHPTIYKSVDEIEKVSVIYPLTYAINSSVIHKIVNIIIDQLKTFSDFEWIDDAKKQSHNWVGFLESLDAIHNPKSNNAFLPISTYRRRIAYDELLASQLAIGIVRKDRSKNAGVSSKFNGNLKESVLEKLQFTLTEGQAFVIKEIEEDQKSDNRMIRLLQGDVGSGKTLVALSAIMNVLEGNHQAAIMAPTDILANQHFTWISKALSELNIKVGLLTGKIIGKKRQAILDDLKSGELKILIGTHAIFQDNVEFQDLRLVIIDEQHRFGVQQRMSLMSKGKDSDVLVMSATPIPRTLSLTMYGDMDISILSGKPKGRMPINTYSLQESKVEKIIELMKKKLLLQEKIYWICPLIEGNLENDNIAAENRFAFLKKVFGDQVGLLHGKLPQDQKEEVMNKFAFHNTPILVSTTVVEVGVDVPEATLLIIECPDKFGLAQLHQLRGRVGRNTKQSDCILLYIPENLTHSSIAKIKIMKESNDGFYIAEQDLKLRGGGDILGSKQSGLPGFRTADLEFHSDLLAEANKDAKSMLENLSHEGTRRNIAMLLNIFGYKKSFDLLNAG